MKKSYGKKAAPKKTADKKKGDKPLPAFLRKKGS
jgi:hypothetical protein